MRYFEPEYNRLIYCEQAASPDFWDSHWQAEDFDKAIRLRNRFVIHWTKRYLPLGSRVLEGGCGRGQNVYSLHYAGYKAYGVDFAKRTVDLINQCAPELNVSQGDVRHLHFPKDFFDGYWSLGVIEHFYEGYDLILSEMARVIRRGGHLFLSFPQMSWLRKIKALKGMYSSKSVATFTFDSDNFYQFALDPEAVINNLKQHGFHLVMRSATNGFKGFKDEAGPAKPLLQRVYNSQEFFARLLKFLVEPLLRSWCGHNAFLVLCKE